MKTPILYIVVPCYNEQEVLPVTKDGFLNELKKLIGSGKIAPESRILYVDDGSSDDTWAVMQRLSDENERISAVRLSRNRGHQNALLAGLMTAKDQCDVTISIDCDGQDDVNAMDGMIDAYAQGCEIVYGVRSNRDSDTFLKRFTAEGFYKLLRMMGAEVVFNHADYRLMSARALKELANYREVNLYLRGMVPLLGYKTSTVEYSRQERQAGKSHYSIRKMLHLAMDGITSLSTKPLSIITGCGAVFTAAGILLAILCIILSMSGWPAVLSIVMTFSGILSVFMGVLGTYIGKTYIEVKNRPRYIISEQTEKSSDNDR